MTYEQFWKGDPELVVYYRRAEEDKREYDATLAYLQGRYFYDALCLVSPLYNPLKPKKPKKFPAEPYPITKGMVRKQEEAKVRKHVAEMKAMLDRYDKASKTDGGEDAGTES